VGALAPPLAAALLMAASVAGMLALLPADAAPLLALGITVPLGAALYGAALHLIAPERLAEALHFARLRGEVVPVAPAAH